MRDDKLNNVAPGTRSRMCRCTVSSCLAMPRCSEARKRQKVHCRRQPQYFQNAGQHRCYQRNFVGRGRHKSKQLLPVLSNHCSSCDAEIAV
jgi:hypothetical protein